MSLLTAPRHTVTVVNTREAQDEDGAVTREELPPQVVRCNVHPVTAAEVESYGLSLTDSYRVTAAAGQWPGGPGARVLWDGHEFIQTGRVLVSRMGRQTQHDRVYIQRGNNA